jgi:hypothetical protein
MSRTFALVVATLCVATGCVFESFEQPVEFIPTTNNNNDGGNTTTNNTTTNNVTTPDMGMTTADMGDESDMADMAMTEPWQCPPKVLSMDGLDNTEVQIEPLDNDTFLATWSTGLDSAVVVRVDIDGNIISEDEYSGLLEIEQRIELLTDETSTFFIFLGRSADVEQLRCDPSCSRFTLTLPRPTLIDGAWNGADEAQYLQVSFTNPPAPAQIAAIGLRNEEQFPPVSEAGEAGIMWHSMALADPPASPELATRLAGVLTTDTEIRAYMSPTTGSNTTTFSCGPEPANVSKVIAYNYTFVESPPSPSVRELLAIADISDGGQPVLARVDCLNQVSVNITESIRFRDWAAIPEPGRIRSFTIGQEGMQMFQFDGRIIKFEMAEDPSFRRVDATQNDNGTIAVLTVTETGVVELRTMNESGQCN